MKYRRFCLYCLTLLVKKMENVFFVFFLPNLFSVPIEYCSYYCATPLGVNFLAIIDSVGRVPGVPSRPADVGSTWIESQVYI